MSQTHSPALPATATKTLHERQRHYDKLHHEKRLQDLDGEWGASMSKHEVLRLRNGSEQALQLINAHGMSCNSVDLSDTDYLADLDRFAARAA